MNKQLEPNNSDTNLLLDDKPKFEELRIIGKIEQREAPKLVLKSLLQKLKYAYLKK